MKEPLVTIVTITYNLINSDRKEYFRQCLSSIHEQSYKNLEHLVVDGGSTDGTLEIIKDYEKKGWINYRSEPDKGIYDALNKGLSWASGKYIAFLHTDDFYNDKDAIKKAVAALENSEADYLYADTRGINHETEEMVHLWRGRLNRIPFGNHYCHQSMLVRTDLLKKMGGFSLKYRVSADSDMMTKLVSKKAKHVYLPEAIVSYRSGGLSNSESSQTRKDHSTVFFKNLGEKEGLTMDDCYSIWNFSLFQEKPFRHNLFFGLKLKRPGWILEYYKKFFTRYFNKRNIIRKLSRVAPNFIKRLLRPLKPFIKKYL